MIDSFRDYRYQESRESRWLYDKYMTHIFKSLDLNISAQIYIDNQNKLYNVINIYI